MAIISKTYGRILASLLVWLGFSAIHTSCTKYGCGTNGLKLQTSGSVVSIENDTPIEGIRVVLKDEYQGYDTTFTAKNGDFFVRHPNLTNGCEQFFIDLHDIDGEKNGSFENLQLSIASKNKQNLGKIRMTPKE